MKDKIQQAIRESQMAVIAAAEQKLGRTLTEAERLAAVTVGLRQPTDGESSRVGPVEVALA